MPDSIRYPRPPPSCRGHPAPTRFLRLPRLRSETRATSAATTDTPNTDEYLLPPKRNVGASLVGARGGPGAATPKQPRPIHNPPIPPPPSYRGNPVPTVGHKRGNTQTTTTQDRQAHTPSFGFPDSDRGPTRRARQYPKLPFLRTPSSPQPVFPSEAEGPETAGGTNSITHEPARPPSCRGHPVPTVGHGRAGHPLRPATLVLVVPGTPGAHGARDGRGYSHPTLIVFPDSDRGPR